MVTLVSHPNADANSYCTIEFADAYFDSIVTKSNWLNLSEDDKARGLIHASIVLDSMVQWYDATVEMINSEVPLNIQRATCELASSIIDNGGFTVSDAQELDALKVGPIELKFSGDYSSSIPGVVTKYLEPYGIVTSPQTSKQVCTPKLVRT